MFEGARAANRILAVLRLIDGVAGLGEARGEARARPLRFRGARVRPTGAEEAEGDEL